MLSDVLTLENATYSAEKTVCCNLDGLDESAKTTLEMVLPWAL